MRLLLANTDWAINADNIEKYYNQLDERRHESVLKQKNADNRIRTLTAGLMIKRICDENDLKMQLVYNEHGKPEFVNSDIKFNLSHSGKYVACAYGNEQVGVDVQEYRFMKDSLIIRFLHETEQKNVLSDLENKQKLANAIWTVKEAYIKMLGTGLSFDMRECVVDFENGIVSDLKNNTKSVFKMYLVEDDYCIAVCQNTGELPEQYEQITFL